MPNFSYLAQLEVCQEPPRHHQWLGGHWGFLIKDMEDMGHLWPHNCSWHWISNVCAIFQPSNTIRSVSRTTPSSSVTWRTLRVSDQRLGGHRSSLTSLLFLKLDSQPVCQISCTCVVGLRPISNTIQKLVYPCHIREGLFFEFLRSDVCSLRYECKHANSLHVSAWRACVHTRRSAKIYMSIH